MIINKELAVSGRKKADIVADLRKKDFTAFPKVVKKKAPADLAEAPADQGDDEDADEQASGNSDFDYLLGMPIWNLTNEKVFVIKLFD